MLGSSNSVAVSVGISYNLYLLSDKIESPHSYTWKSIQARTKGRERFGMCAWIHAFDHGMTL
jgi:hypothetical protein